MPNFPSKKTKLVTCYSGRSTEGLKPSRTESFEVFINILVFQRMKGIAIDYFQNYFLIR